MSTDSSGNTPHDIDVPELTARITNSLQVRVQPVRHHWDHHPHPVHAINWFDTRSLWLYNLYNAIAAGSVEKVGGVPLFKGRWQETLYGQQHDQRETLLLVRYPSAENFTSMLANRLFQITSVLREIAVKHFSFGLSKATTVELSEWGGKDTQHYLVHHWTSTDQGAADEERERFHVAAKHLDVSVAFSARIEYTLALKKANTESTQVPCLMHQLLLLSHTDQRALRNCIASDSYKAALELTDTSYIALMSRIA